MHLVGIATGPLGERVTPTVRPKLTRAQSAVHRSLLQLGPSTYDELARAKAHLPCADYANEGISRRIRELADKGYVQHVGDQIGPNGWPRNVWAAV